MNYRHAYHAGNFADVHKHAALVAILSYLRKKETPFAVIDTHAGPGLYDLSGTEAVRSGEADEGIARLANDAARTPALAAYLELTRGFGPQHYPGSPLIAARLLRPQDRLVAIERHPDDFAALRVALNRIPNAHAMLADGYARLPALLPSPERRGLILLDPPYEEADEWQRLAKTFGDAYRRFPQGVYLIWYPRKTTMPAEALAGELENAGAARLLSLTFNVGSTKGDAPGKLAVSGLLAVNPPYGFDEKMGEVQRELLPLLGRGEGAKAGVEWFVGAP